jgi:hypothetical protein
VHAELLVEGVEGGGAGVPELGLAAGGVVDTLGGNGVFALDGLLDGLGPLADGALELLDELGVAADFVVVHAGGNLGNINRNFSVGLLEAGGDL